MPWKTLWTLSAPRSVPQDPTPNGNLLKYYEFKVFSLPVTVSTFARVVQFGGGKVVAVRWHVEVANVRWRSAVPATGWQVRVTQWTFDPSSRCAIVLCAKRCLATVSCSRRTIQCVLVIRELFTREYGSRVFRSEPCRPLFIHFQLNQLSLITKTHCS